MNLNIIILLVSSVSWNPFPVNSREQSPSCQACNHFLVKKIPILNAIRVMSDSSGHLYSTKGSLLDDCERVPLACFRLRYSEQWNSSWLWEPR